MHSNDMTAFKYAHDDKILGSSFKKPPLVLNSQLQEKKDKLRQLINSGHAANTGGHRRNLSIKSDDTS
jgi:hypothetical protein